MESIEPPLPSRENAIQLDGRKAMHVFTDGPLLGLQRQLEARRYLWIQALDKSIRMLRVSMRAGTWLEATAPTWDRTDDAFPSLFEAGLVKHGMAQMAVITFLTVFKSGRALGGDVAGNATLEIRTFRERCVAMAFPAASDREAFEDLLARLENARDGLLAHADGSAQQFEFAESVTSFGSHDAGVSRDDAALLLECAQRLSEVVQTARAA